MESVSVLVLLSLQL